MASEIFEVQPGQRCVQACILKQNSHFSEAKVNLALPGKCVHQKESECTQLVSGTCLLMAFAYISVQVRFSLPSYMSRWVKCQACLQDDDPSAQSQDYFIFTKPDSANDDFLLDVYRVICISVAFPKQRRYLHVAL